MRSRDGDPTILRRFGAVVLFLFLCEMLQAGEYLISYSYTIKNALVYNEKLQIAKAMQPCEGELFGRSLYLAYPEDEDSEPLKKIILENFDDFFSYISKLGLEVEHHEKSANMQDSFTTRVLLPTTCFKVLFNDSFVTITAIK